jgi:hypothetical protein
VNGASWAVTDASGQPVPSQTVVLDERTRELPLLYLNSFNMTDAQRAAAEKLLANNADHVLVFHAEVPPVGMATFTAKAGEDATVEVGGTPAPVSRDAPPTTVQSDTYSLEFDGASGLLQTITNLKSGVSTALEISWGWYNSSVGGCTEYSAEVPASIRSPPCDVQKSGAYIFRPNSSTLFYPGAPQTPTVSVVRGPLVTEVYQKFSEWASHVIRLYEGKNFVEIEWTAGPIPMDTPWFPPVAHDKKNASKPLPNMWGKEVVVKYASALKSGGAWYTDSNGKEMVKRVYNKRGPSYPKPYNISEEVAGNYYPVNALMSLDDGVNELAILTDVSQAGASLADGELELMVHRRIQDDDSRGVQEPLNETMCGCNDIGADPGKMGAHGHEGDGGCVCAGLTVRGRHWLVLDTIANAHEARRKLSEDLNFPPIVALTPPPKPGQSETSARPSATFSALSKALPPNVKLVTLTNNYAHINGGKLLLRLSHLYAAGEHPTLAQPVTVDLESVFGKAGLKILGATETTLTANQPLATVEARRHKWATHMPNRAVAEHFEAIKGLAFEERVPFDFPQLTLRPMEVRTFLATFE